MGVNSAWYTGIQTFFFSFFLADFCLHFVRLAPLSMLNEPLAVPVCS